MKPTEDQKKFAAALGKVVVDLCDMKPGSAIKGLLDAALAYKKDDPPPPTPQAAAELLLRRSAAVAAAAVFQRHRNLSLEAGTVEVETAAENLALEIPLPDLTARTFAAPEGWDAMDALATLFGGWLAACHIPEKRRPEMTRAFRDEMPLALRAEFLERSKDYGTLTDLLDKTTHVDAAAKRTEDWRRYRAKLVADVAKPLPNIDRDKIPEFSLAELHVPLRATWTEPDRTGERKTRRQIAWLHEVLKGWIEAADSKDTVRVITGGPGSGKSSACRMLAADMARRGRRVLLAPLGQLEYDQGAVTALTTWAAASRNLDHDPFAMETMDEAEPMILILDGLDELVKVGKVGEQIVDAFVTDLHRLVANSNEDRLRVLLLLTSRPQAARATIQLSRKLGTTLEAMSFGATFDESDMFRTKDLAAIDQRNHWWRLFCGGSMPDCLLHKGPRLEDVTTQPLLNWLLAQILILEGSEYTGTIDNVHRLYKKLMKHVLDKSHRNPIGEATDALERDKLECLLEEIAIAAWHDGDRTVNLNTIRNRLDCSHSETLNMLCEKNQPRAIDAILDSFFIKPKNTTENQGGFEFTHKSFREFLTISRLIREMRKISDHMEKRQDIKESASWWIDLCGPTQITEDLLVTLTDALTEESDDNLVKLSEICRELIEYSIHNGITIESASKTNSKNIEKHVRNYEESLLAFNAKISDIIGLRNKSPLPKAIFLNTHEDIFTSIWLHRTIGPRFIGWIAPLCLINCKFHDTNFSGFDLSRANFSFSCLQNSKFMGSNLTGAIFLKSKLIKITINYSNFSNSHIKETDMSDSIIYMANFSSATLINCSIRNAHVTHSNFTNANLYCSTFDSSKFNDCIFDSSCLFGANFENSQLVNANMRMANLAKANLAHANLRYSCLEHTNIVESNFFHSDLTGANIANSDAVDAIFDHADLTKTNFSHANMVGVSAQYAKLKDTHLTGANLFGAKLNQTHLHGANLQGANLEQADLRGAVLKNANLKSVNLKGANLEGANLRDANLRGANLDRVRGLTDEELADLKRRAAEKDEDA